MYSKIDNNSSNIEEPRKDYSDSNNIIIDTIIKYFEILVKPILLLLTVFVLQMGFHSDNFFIDLLLKISIILGIILNIDRKLIESNWAYLVLTIAFGVLTYLKINNLSEHKDIWLYLFSILLGIKLASLYNNRKSNGKHKSNQ